MREESKAVSLTGTRTSAPESLRADQGYGGFSFPEVAAAFRWAAQPLRW